MPKVLRWFTWMCFAFVLFLPLSLIPAGGHYINGTEVSFAEFWHRGGGPIFFVAGILFPVTGYGFVRAQNWSRFVFTALHFVIALTTVFYGSISFDAALAFAWVGFVAYYLFWRPNVRDYFTRVDDAGT